MAGRSPGDPHRLSRSWWRLWRGSGARVAGSRAGRGPMAPDGECQRGLPRRGEEVDEADPRRSRSDDYRPEAPDFGRADPVRRLSAAGGDERGGRKPCGRWHRDQGDRSANGSEPEAGSPDRPRRAHRCIPHATGIARPAPSLSRRPVGSRLPERCRTLASSSRPRVQGLAPRRRRMGHAAQTIGADLRSPSFAGSRPREPLPV